MRIKKRYLLGLVIPLIYLLISLFTLSDYGFTDDTIWRYYAGEAYLHQYKTGQSVIENIGDVRYYGPFADILAAFSHKILTEKLKIMNPLSSHYLIPALFTTLLFFIIFLFASEIFDVFTAIFAQTSLFLIPRFYGYSHIEMSMAPLAALFAFTLYSLWKSFTTGKKRWILASAILFGLTFAIRVHALFTLIIIGIWLLLSFIFYRAYLSEQHKLQQKRILYWILFPVLAFLTLYAVWPWLWSSAFKKIIEVISFFKKHTFNAHVFYNGNLYLAGVDLPWHYTLTYIFITVPMILLIFFLIGSYKSVKDFFQKKNQHSIIFVLWFLVVLIAHSMPGVVVYDGVRQFLHIFPSIAVLSGIGIKTFYDFLQNRLSAKLSVEKVRYGFYILITLLFLPIAYNLIAYHPYQHVYFNELVGGIRGANGRFDLHTYGTYRNEALDWINKNAEQGSSFIGIPQDYQRTFPFYVRPDLKVIGENATYTIIGNSHAFEPFPDVKPVYERSIKGEHIFRIYKNVNYSDKMVAAYLGKNYRPRK